MVTFVAVLKDSAGIPLAGKTINLYGSNSGTSWTLMGSATTDNTGTATLTAAVANYYYAAFPGDNLYEPATSPVLVSSGASPPPLTPTALTLSASPLDRNVLLTAVLKDGAGNPLSGKPVEFYYSNDGQNWRWVYTANTNEVGVATYASIVHPYFVAVFKGDNQYAPATSNVVQVAAPSPGPSPSPSPSPSPLPITQPGGCCAFTDFGCWFLKRGKCVNVFNMAVDSMLLSVLLIALAALFILALAR